MLTKCFAWVFLILFDWVSQVTFAYAIRPFGAIWRALPGAYGDAITETCGIVFSFSSSALTRARTAGSVILPVSRRDHDLVGLAGDRGRVALQQLDGGEAVGVRQLEVVGVGAADRAVERVQSDERRRSTRPPRSIYVESTSEQAFSSRSIVPSFLDGCLKPMSLCRYRTPASAIEIGSTSRSSSSASFSGVSSSGTGV